MKKRVLVVVDMQNDFVNGALGTAEAEQILQNVVAKINEYKANEDYIIYTMDTHDQEYLLTQEGHKLPVSHCVYPESGWQLHPRIAEAMKETKGIGKTEYRKDVFGAWSLAEDMKGWTDIEEVELCGLCTGICVISNAILIKSALPEMPITVDAACCACVTPKSHETALDAMELLQVNVINR